MIYICRGIAEIFKLPCTLCKCACKCCDESCKAFDRACGACCTSIKECWAPIIDNPLGMFVLGTWALQGLIVLCVGYALSGVSDECTGDADEKSSVIGFLGVMALFAIIHSAFARYIQWKLVKDIREHAGEDTKVSHLVWEILKRDIPFCLYFFFAIGAFAVACWGYANSLHKCGDTVKTGTGGVVGLAICYGMLSPCYGCCFVCGKATSETARRYKGSRVTAPTPAVPGSATADAMGKVADQA